MMPAPVAGLLDTLDDALGQGLAVLRAMEAEGVTSAELSEQLKAWNLRWVGRDDLPLATRILLFKVFYMLATAVMRESVKVRLQSFKGGVGQS